MMRLVSKAADGKAGILRIGIPEDSRGASAQAPAPSKRNTLSRRPEERVGA
jgi:hypothetical protein